jgi:thiosulfate reductase cytochrome b subunit
MKRRAQPWMIRFTHWLNIPLLIIMAGSGLEILAAFPALGPRGALYRWYPFQNDPPPTWLRLGDWLAGARHLHFAFAWLFIINGLLYWTYLVATGQWRSRYFLPLRDTPNAVQTFAHYLRIRKEAPEQGFYNGLQRLAYSTASLLAALIVLSGFAMYKPVQLHWLATLFGGYDGARAVHLILLVLFASFTVMHVILVALHPRTIGVMITGGKEMVGEAARE